MDFIEDFLFMRTRAYEIGLKGIRDFPLFVGIDENSTQRDIDEAIRAYVIGLNGEGAGEVVDIAIRMFTPEFQDYIRGLRDSCRERKNA
jgi:ribosome recycling factor